MSGAVEQRRGQSGKRTRLRDLKSSGNERWVYRASSVDDLVGVHADLIESQLRTNDDIRYLLYSPKFMAGGTPYGEHVEPASHAIGVTNDRFLFSRNPHNERESPSVEAVPFDEILCIEYGAELLLGWFVIRFACGASLSSRVILYNSVGSGVFAGAIRMFRSTLNEIPVNKRESHAASWTDFYAKIPVDLAQRIKPLVLDEEHLLHFVRNSPQWVSVKTWLKKVPVNLANEGALAVTDSALFHCNRQPMRSPEEITLGDNVTCIPRSAVSEGVIVRTPVRGRSCSHHLRFTLERAGARLSINVPFDEDWSSMASMIVRALGGRIEAVRRLEEG